MPEDEWATAIGELNASGVPVVAVDIPSGVDGTSGAVAGDAVAAEITVTFGAAKTGALLLPGGERAGQLRVVDIGFPDELLQTDLFLTEPRDVAAVLPRREADTHKRASGVLMIVAGSRGMTGAPRLMAEAAGRMGAGLVIVAVPAEILPIVQSGLVETVFVGLPSTDEGTVAASAVEELLERLADVDALALGPGMTTSAETAGAIRALVSRSPVPVVLDADGLNAFTGEAQAIADRRSEVVLTPHVGEFGRLTGVKPRDLEADRIGHVRRLVTESDAVSLLKGSRTLIAAPDGHARINLTGSPVLATAGSGDVLTGTIGGLLARGLGALDAGPPPAPYLHGLAGTLAGRTQGEGTLAGDVAARLPEAVARRGGQLMRHRPTFVRVDLAAIRHNAALLTPGGVRLMAVVKADAYGHGDAVVARAALEGGASWLGGRAGSRRASGLRAAGIDAPILVLVGVPARLGGRGPRGRDSRRRCTQRGAWSRLAAARARPARPCR